jgi:hypothetical protein
MSSAAEYSILRARRLMRRSSSRSTASTSGVPSPGRRGHSIRRSARRAARVVSCDSRCRCRWASMLTSRSSSTLDSSPFAWTWLSFRTTSSDPFSSISRQTFGCNSKQRALSAVCRCWREQPVFQGDPVHTARPSVRRGRFEDLHAAAVSTPARAVLRSRPLLGVDWDAHVYIVDSKLAPFPLVTRVDAQGSRKSEDAGESD